MIFHNFQIFFVFIRLPLRYCFIATICGVTDFLKKDVFLSLNWHLRSSNFFFLLYLYSLYYLVIFPLFLFSFTMLLAPIFLTSSPPLLSIPSSFNNFSIHHTPIALLCSYAHIHHNPPLSFLSTSPSILHTPFSFMTHRTADSWQSSNLFYQIISPLGHQGSDLLTIACPFLPSSFNNFGLLLPPASLYNLTFHFLTSYCFC